MAIYISILRGINVGGNRIIRMKDLKEMYESLQLTNVETFIQSGNVIFQSGVADGKKLANLISGRIQSQFGFDVPVIVLDTNELRDIISKNPFKDDRHKNDARHVAVTFLDSEPKDFDPKEIIKKKAPEEEFSIAGKAVYLFCPNGFGRTKLTNTLFERVLKTGATGRNWNTTLELLNIAERIERRT